MERDELRLDKFIEAMNELGFKGLPLEEYFEEFISGKMRYLKSEHLRMFGGDSMQYLLHFRAKEDHYPYLSGYNATLAAGDTGAQVKRSHYFIIRGRLDDVTATEAYNLLCGRNALKFHIVGNNIVAQWIGLEQVTGTPDRLLERTYPSFEIGDQLRAMPIQEMETDREGLPLIRSLLEGNLVQAHLQIPETVIPVFLSADPAKGGIRIQDTTLNELDLGTLLKADHTKKISPKQDIKKNKKRFGKGKGRSI